MKSICYSLLLAVVSAQEGYTCDDATATADNWTKTSMSKYCSDANECKSTLESFGTFSPDNDYCLMVRSDTADNSFVSYSYSIATFGGDIRVAATDDVATATNHAWAYVAAVVLDDVVPEPEEE